MDVVGVVLLCLLFGCINILLGQLPHILVIISSLNLVLGALFLPSIFRYDRILKAYIQPARRHRSHWRFLTPRRWRQYFQPALFTVFMMGVLAKSVSLCECNIHCSESVYQ
jgi:hypothetical protein